MRKERIDGRGELRYIEEEPFEDYFGTIEYESKTQDKKTNQGVPIEGDELRTPENENDIEKARQAEDFLKNWGV